MLISHATSDKTKIRQLQLIEGLLATKAVELWCDNGSKFLIEDGNVLAELNDIPPNSVWRRKLAWILDNIDVVLVCWSQAYVAKVSTEGDEAGGRWVRDEVEPAEERRCAIHIELEQGLQIPARFRNTFADRQICRLWEFDGYPQSVQNECRKIAVAAREIMDRNAKFVADFDTMSRFIDRDPQETPFVRVVGPLAACGVVLLRGRDQDDPEELAKRFEHFTWPARRLLDGGDKRSLDDLRSDGLAGPLDKDGLKYSSFAVRNAFSRPTVSAELDFLGNEFASYAPRIERKADETALSLGLRMLERGAQPSPLHKAGVHYMAKLLVQKETWKKRPGHVCEVVLGLAAALAAASSSWMTVFVILEEEEEPAGLFGAAQSLFRLVKKPKATIFDEGDERFPADASHPALGARLEPLKPVDPGQAADWGRLVARKWATNIDVDRRIREKFGDQPLPMRKARAKLEDAVREVWHVHQLSKGNS